MTQIVMTAVVPAPNGCNLNCRGCIIAQRGEAEKIVLTPEDYVHFCSEVLEMPEVRAFALQGYEPLLPEAWPLSEKLLRMSVRAGKHTSCVTNGTYLTLFMERLLDVTHNVFVSIDSHDAKIHDDSRRKEGAWNETVNGIRALQRLFGTSAYGKKQFAEYLSVGSIMYPGKSARLWGMPELLAELGVEYWAITPFIALKKKGFCEDYKTIKENLQALGEKARKFGIQMSLSDELRALENVGDLYQVLTISTLDRDNLVTRLSPDAGYSVGREIVEGNAPRIWTRDQSPTAFVTIAHETYLKRLGRVS